MNPLLRIFRRLTSRSSAAGHAENDVIHFSNLLNNSSPSFLKRYPLSQAFRRSLWTVLLITGVLLGVIGCGPATPPAGRVLFHEAPEITFGVFPFLEETRLRSSLEPLGAYLSRCLRRPVTFRVVGDYGEFENMMIRRRLHVAWFTPRTSPKAIEEAYEVLCRPQSPTDGSYVGCIIARASDSLTTPADLKGRSFAYVDRKSNSGFFYINRRLLELGLDPLRHFGRISFSGAHDRSLEGVLNGTYDAAAVSDLVLRTRTASAPALPIVVLATTSPILADPILAQKSLPWPLRDDLRAALSGIASTPEGPAVLQALAHLGITGFAAP
jgi:phosphonate transport system substrate-binding protein